MRVKDLFVIVKILSQISNTSSLTPLYRSIELDKEQVRCCSEFGNISIIADDTGVAHPVLLDTAAVIGVLNTLPKDSDITFSEDETGNRLTWNCSSATGYWNTVFSEHKIPDLIHKDFPWTPHASFPLALNLAAAACQATAVSIGLYGIAIEPVEEQLYILSSNSISLACSKIPKGDFPTGQVVVRPPVPGIIATLVSVCPNCTLDITKEGLFIHGDWLKAHLPVAPALEHDLKDIVKDFEKREHSVPLDGNAVRKFITRSRAISDKTSSFTISLRVSEGKLILTHTGIASATEEFFLAEGLPADVNYKAVALQADMILISLSHVETVIFDYLKENQLVMRCSDPDYLYVVGGGE